MLSVRVAAAGVVVASLSFVTAPAGACDFDRYQKKCDRELAARAESESAEESENPCDPRWQHQDEDDEEKALDRDPEEGARHQVIDPVRHEERSPDQEQGQGRGHGGASAGWASGESVSRKDAGKQPWCPRPIR